MILQQSIKMVKKLINKKNILLIAKLLFVIISFYIIYKKTELELVFANIKNLDVKLLIAAFFTLICSQYISSLRLRYYFGANGLNLSKWQSSSIYFIGNFFNNLLPGGIGGDGYIIYLIGKLKHFSKVKSLQIMLSCRASGLMWLIIFAYIMASFSNHFSEFHIYGILLKEWMLNLTIIPIILIYILTAKFIMKENIRTIFSAAIYSILVQLVSLLSAFFLLTALSPNDPEMVDYLVLFMISSIVAVLPISVAGAGLRELTFIYASSLFGLEKELGVAFALVFFSMNIVCSVIGLSFWMKLSVIKKQYG